MGTFKRLLNRIKFGKITEKVTATIENVPSEIEYYDCKGRKIGFWAYGYFHPNYPYQG